MTVDRYVVDASVVVKWYLDEPEAEAARAFRSRSFDLSAPHLLLMEVANVLWKRLRKNELDAVTGSLILSNLRQVPIRWSEDAGLYQEAFTLAAELGRTVYDSTYLTLAIREHCRLVTADRRFYNALASSSVGSSLAWIGEFGEPAAVTPTP